MPTVELLVSFTGWEKRELMSHNGGLPVAGRSFGATLGRMDTTRLRRMMEKMRMMRAIRSLTHVLMLVVTTTCFVACGGGAGGGSGGGGAALLELVAVPSFGTMGATNTVQTFNTNVASPQSLVGPTNFVSAAGGDANFIQLNFSSTVSEASILNGGIQVTGSDNVPRSIFLDKAGAIMAENAFAGDAAPAMLRVYFEDPMNPGVPVALPADGYNVRLSNLLLRSGGGEAFCVAETGGVCMLTSDANYYFTLDGQNSPMGATPLASGPTPALPLPAIFQADDELRIFFDRPVDFQSVVGFNPATGLVNVTSQDQFCSIPFTPGNAPAVGANILVNYTPPPPTVLPANYGYIVYMPNPFNDPSEIRVRFVDPTNLTPLDDPTGMFSATGLPTSQNYSIPSAVWDNALLTNPGLNPPTDMSAAQTGLLELPPKLPLPGSNAQFGTATIQVTLASPTSGIATDSSAVNPANADGVVGVTDRARNALAADITINRTMATGPAISNNPEPPDLNVVENGTILGGFSSAGNTIIPGSLFPIAGTIDDATVLADVSDVMFGAFINPANNTGNPPRRLNNMSVIMQGIDPGTPFPPGGTPEAGGGVQPLGARMYVVDGAAGQVKIFNSNTFQPLGIVPGVASPGGLGMGGGFFYVSNFGQDTVQRFGATPGTAAFHQVVSTAAVGAGPTVVTFQPDGEDVGCINRLANTFSFIDIPTFVERAAFPSGMGPSELVMTPRWTGMGTPFAFMAFVPNSFSNTVTIFESDSPLQTPVVANGPQGKVLEDFTGFSGPTNGCWNQFLGVAQGLGGQGMYVPNSLGSSVDYMGMTMFNLGPMPGFAGPPGSRIFSNVASYGGVGVNQASGLQGGAVDCVIDPTDLTLNGSALNIIATFPQDGRVATFNILTSLLQGTASVPGNKIFTSADQ